MPKKTAVQKNKKNSRKPRQLTTKAVTAPRFSFHYLLLTLEILSLSFVVVLAIMILLGQTAAHFSGVDLYYNILPFAGCVLVMTLMMTLFLLGWKNLRNRSGNKAVFVSPLLAVLMAVTAGSLMTHEEFKRSYEFFRNLVGGSREAFQLTIAHQVYAAYRRSDPAQLNIMFERAMKFSKDIQEAAHANGIDPFLLYGIAATETSFLPRDGIDGGRGLFQITRVPEAAVELAKKYFRTNWPEINNHRQNAFIAAATLQYYLNRMDDDLVLALLAYNIGPANGGLQFIMTQYGVNNFATIQPYLQKLPGEYPIRVLTFALAFQLSEKEKNLPRYEEDNNASLIQNHGIPGLQMGGE